MYTELTFSSGGFSRLAKLSNSGKPDVIISLHGAGSGPDTMLNNIKHGDPDVTYVALEALQWTRTPPQGSNKFWIMDWNLLPENGPPVGADAMTDVVAIRDLVALLKAEHGAQRVAIMGFSFGASMVLWLNQQGADVVAFGAFSSLVHNSHVPLSAAELKPFVYSAALNDPNLLAAVDHQTIQETRESIAGLFGAATSGAQKDGKTCSRWRWRSLLTPPSNQALIYTVIDNKHKWYSCAEGHSNEETFLDFCRGLGVLA